MKEKIKCPFCSEERSDKYELGKHIKKEHKGKWNFKCKCGCGQITNPGYEFINHHNGRVKSVETLAKSRAVTKNRFVNMSEEEKNAWAEKSRKGALKYYEDHPEARKHKSEVIKKHWKEDRIPNKKYGSHIGLDKNNKEWVEKVSEGKKEWWGNQTEEEKKEISKKISDSVKFLRDDPNSVYNTEEYKKLNKLRSSAKETIEKAGKTRSVKYEKLGIESTKCPFCDLLYKDIPTLQNHIYKYHPGKWTHTCECSPNCSVITAPMRKYIKGHGANVIFSLSNKRGKRGYYFSSKTNEKEFYHSSWEEKYMKMLDDDPDVIYWTKKHGINIPYIFEEKDRLYLPDFFVSYLDRKEIVEVKPEDELKLPLTIAKHTAAEEYCCTKNYKFSVISKDSLGLSR